MTGRYCLYNYLIMISSRVGPSYFGVDFSFLFKFTKFIFIRFIRSSLRNENSGRSFDHGINFNCYTTRYGPIMSLIKNKRTTLTLPELLKIANAAVSNTATDLICLLNPIFYALG